MRKGVLRLFNFILAFLLGVFAVGYTFAWYTNKENFSLQLLGTAKTYFAGGSGTEEDPYLIANAQHLYNLAYLQNKGELNKGTKYYFELNDNINMSGIILPPIGNDTNAFCGEFNGKGYTISNLVVSTNKNILHETDPARGSAYAFSNAVGFFGMTAKDSNIKNVILSNPVVEVASTDVAGVSTKYSSGSANCVGIAIGYINSSASSIGVIGGKLAIRREKYTTINSILGGAGEDVTVNITGGNADVGIFYPNPESDIAKIISKNGEAGATTFENGMWLIPATSNSALGNFSITSKPTINDSRTVYGDVGTKNAYSVGKNQTVDTVFKGKDYSSYITNETGTPITSISGYLSFSGKAEQNSYDSLYYENDEYGKSQTGYSAGSYAVQQNAIKFNITNDNSYVYVIAASNAPDDTRYLRLYKTTDTSGDAVDYSNPADFYQLYQCTGDEQHSQHEYYWNKTTDSTTSTVSTLIYYDGTSYSQGLNPDGTACNNILTTCNRTVNCKGTVEYINGKYVCNVCGKEYDADKIVFTDECLLHAGGIKQSVELNSQTGSYLYQAYNFYNKETNESYINDAKYLAATDNDTHGITDITIVGVGKVKSNAYTYNPLTSRDSSNNYKTDTSTKYNPVKINSKGSLSFKAQVNGVVTLSGRTVSANTISITTFEDSTDSKGTTVAAKITKSSTVASTYTDSGVKYNVYDYTYQLTVEAGKQYTITKATDDDEFSLSTLTYVSSEKYSGELLTCSQSNTHHEETDFKIDNSKLSHTYICGAEIELVKAAKYQEVVSDLVDEMTLTGTPTFYVFKIEKKGSYQLASKEKGIRIYYLRVKGMYGGNARLSNVTNVDFVYDGVTIVDQEYTEDGTTYTTTAFRKDDKDYNETNTCISLVDSCPAIVLYFYRDDDGTYFAVGTSVSGKTSGFPTYTTLVDNISIGADYVDTPWVYTPNQ